MRPSSARKGVPYRCPSCKDPLIFKAGPIRVRHFAHDRSATCTSESVLHHTAKLLVAEQRRPAVLRKCTACFEMREQTLEREIAQLEYRLPSGRVADVALLVGGRPSCAVEVRVTHAVTLQKAQEIGLPWIEVDAEDIVRDPEVWRPSKDRLGRFRCRDCEARSEDRKRAAIRLAADRGVKLPPSPPYSFATYPCYNCKREILVYTWSDRTHPPPSPVPATLRMLRRWVNSCDGCGAAQADALLYASERGPFFGMA